MPIQKKTVPDSPSLFSFTLRLPGGYAVRDALAFHGRDAQGVSERVGDARIEKGVLLNGTPAVFDIAFDLPASAAYCTVLLDGAIDAAMLSLSEAIASNLLGLRIDPEQFRGFVAGDPVFGPLVERQKDLRIVQSSSIFEALTWAIMGQQINVCVAVSLRRTFVQLAGRRHSGGLLCYPDPADAARLDIGELTSRQFSRSKAETVLRLAGLVASGELDLEEGPGNPLSSIIDALLDVKGIGPWSVNYALLRGYGHADCSLHGDVAVRSAIGKLRGDDTRPDMPAAQAFLQRYSPHRTMAAAHLWASLSASANY